MTQSYKAPLVPAEHITPEFVRDELLNCFQSANREFLTLLATPYTEDALKNQVKEFVVSVFGKCGASYINPTKEGIVTAISESRQNAEAMMGPKGADMIRHHYTEMMTLVNQLP